MENHPTSASRTAPSVNLRPGVQPFPKSLESRGSEPRYEESAPKEMANRREGRKDMMIRYDSKADQRGADIIDLSFSTENQVYIR